MSQKTSIFQHHDYREFLRERLKAMPSHGRGQLSRIAKHLGMSSVSISHVMSATRDFTEEQALDLSQYLGLSTLEEDYLILLVREQRASSPGLRSKIRTQLELLRTESRTLKNRIEKDLDLSREAQAEFYSQWHYSAFRLLSDVPGFDTVDALAEYFRLPRAKVRGIFDFLVKHGLCVETDGKYQLGVKRTYLDAESPFASQHFTNWRLKGIDHVRNPEAADLFYTAPMVLSESTMAEIRTMLVDIVSQITKLVAPSPSEKLVCLNVDWFAVRQ